MDRTYFAAFDRFDEVRDRGGVLLDRVLPAEPGLAHAAYLGRFGKPPRPGDVEISYRPPYERALCGAPVKALLSLRFDVGDPDACPACVSAAGDNAKPPPAWYPRGDEEDWQLWSRLPYRDRVDADEE